MAQSKVMPVKPLGKDKQSAGKRRDFVAALSHGLLVLSALSESGNGMSLEKLAKRTGLKKTTAWRLAQTLVELEYIQQDPETRSLRPAPKVLTLGYAYFDSLDLRQLALPFLRDLSARVGESVNL